MKSITGAYLLSLVAVALIITFMMWKTSASKNSGSRDQSNTEISAVADSVINENYCPCGCGNFLPGSAAGSACFGCSVGKAEVSRIREAFLNGKSKRDVSNLVSDPVLVDVFSDYTDEDLSTIWNMAKQAALEFGQQRVVLRTPARTIDARNAIKLAECARGVGKFFELQEALIAYQGPWDLNSLLKLGLQRGLDETQLRNCLRETDIGPQVAKDRQHAQRRGIRFFPTVSVNRKTVEPTAQSLRDAIRKIVLEGTI